MKKRFSDRPLKSPPNNKVVQINKIIIEKWSHNKCGDRNYKDSLYKYMLSKSKHSI